MSKKSEQSPFQIHPPSVRRLWLTVLAAIALSGIVLITIVLPAEYAIDVTGTGKLLGLTKTPNADQIVLNDTLGGNEKVSAGGNVKLSGADALKPLPLPNPAVHQSQTEPAKTETFTLKLPPFSEAEIKAVMKEGKMMLYSWKVKRGDIYVDFHGHDPAWKNKHAFVRYEEKKGSTGAHGSLVAPFDGEHGWYWYNKSESTVTITLSVQGYFDKMINYGLLK